VQQCKCFVKEIPAPSGCSRKIRSPHSSRHRETATRIERIQTITWFCVPIPQRLARNDKGSYRSGINR
jgi:hypothetical protein